MCCLCVCVHHHRSNLVDPGRCDGPGWGAIHWGPDRQPGHEIDITEGNMLVSIPIGISTNIEYCLLVAYTDTDSLSIPQASDRHHWIVASDFRTEKSWHWRDVAPLE